MMRGLSGTSPSLRIKTTASVAKLAVASAYASVIRLRNYPPDSREVICDMACKKICDVICEVTSEIICDVT